MRKGMVQKSLLGLMAVLWLLAGAADAQSQKKGPGPMPACCQKMKAQHTEAATALDSKVAAMNAAQGSEKVDAIAAVVNELVAQHHAMHAAGGCPAGACPAGACPPGACAAGACPAGCPMMGAGGTGGPPTSSGAAGEAGAGGEAQGGSAKP